MRLESRQDLIDARTRAKQAMEQEKFRTSCLLLDAKSRRAKECGNSFA